MTLVSDIITRAYRESNIIAIGATPTANEMAEGLVLLNSVVQSSVGNEIADSLNDLVIGGTYDQSQYLTPWVPDNTRLVLNLSAPLTVTLDPYPFEGQRFAVVDVSGNLATNNLTVNGNNRNIGGASTLVLNTNGTNSHYLFRSDTGNWVKISDLISSDVLPFPEEFDEYFVLMTAGRINPRNGATLNDQSMLALKRMRSQIHSRYCNFPQIESDVPYRHMLSNWYNYYGYSSSQDFSSGRPWYWR